MFLQRLAIWFAIPLRMVALVTELARNDSQVSE